MKVTMMSVMCGPEGNATQGQVVDIPKDRMQTVFDEASGKEVQVPLAKYLIDQKFARPYDEHKDRKARHGLSKAEK